MINVMGKQALKLKVIENERPKLKDKWCEQEQEDINRFFEMVEDLVQISSNSHTSAMAYQQMTDAKAAFVNQVLDCWSRYRMVEDPEQHRQMYTK